MNITFSFSWLLKNQRKQLNPKWFAYRSPKLPFKWGKNFTFYIGRIGFTFDIHSSSFQTRG